MNTRLALLGLPLIAFALSAPLHAQGLGSPSISPTGEPVPPPSMTDAGRAQMRAYKAQERADGVPMRGNQSYDDRSGGVGTGAGSSAELGGSTPGGGINGSGSGNGKP